MAEEQAILAGGCVALQLRAKQLPDRDRLALARALRPLARARGVSFVDNDRPDLAMEIIRDARRRIGDRPDSNG